MKRLFRGTLLVMLMALVGGKGFAQNFPSSISVTKSPDGKYRTTIVVTGVNSTDSSAVWARIEGTNTAYATVEKNNVDVATHKTVLVIVVKSPGDFTVRVTDGGISSNEKKYTVPFSAITPKYEYPNDPSFSDSVNLYPNEGSDKDTYPVIASFSVKNQTSHPQANCELKIIYGGTDRGTANNNYSTTYTDSYQSLSVKIKARPGNILVKINRYDNASDGTFTCYHVEKTYTITQEMLTRAGFPPTSPTPVQVEADCSYEFKDIVIENAGSGKFRASINVKVTGTMDTNIDTSDVSITPYTNERIQIQSVDTPKLDSTKNTIGLTFYFTNSGKLKVNLNRKHGASDTAEGKTYNITDSMLPTTYVMNDIRGISAYSNNFFTTIKVDVSRGWPNNFSWNDVVISDNTCNAQKNGNLTLLNGSKKIEIPIMFTKAGEFTLGLRTTHGGNVIEKRKFTIDNDLPSAYEFPSDIGAITLTRDGKYKKIFVINVANNWRDDITRDNVKVTNNYYNVPFDNPILDRNKKTITLPVYFNNSGNLTISLNSSHWNEGSSNYAAKKEYTISSDKLPAKPNFILPTPRDTGFTISKATLNNNVVLGIIIETKTDSGTFEIKKNNISINNSQVTVSNVTNSVTKTQNIKQAGYNSAKISLTTLPPKDKALEFTVTLKDDGGNTIGGPQTYSITANDIKAILTGSNTSTGLKPTDFKTKSLKK